MFTINFEKKGIPITDTIGSKEISLEACPEILLYIFHFTSYCNIIIF